MYFDNAATTKPFDEVIAISAKIAKENYYNSQATYAGGLESLQILQHERENIARLIGANENEIIFTGGGTEANNLAIFGGAKNKKGRIISTQIEHPSVYNCMLNLQTLGYDVRFADILPNGKLDENSFANLLTNDVSLVSIMHANNETGTVNDIAKLAKMTKSANPNVLFHSDGVQAFAKIDTNVAQLGVDFYSISPHKFGGQKGVGVLFVKKGTNPKQHIFGGGQERTLRSGTENLAAIATISTAYRLFVSQKAQFLEICKYFEETIFGALNAAKTDYKRNGANGLPHIFNVSFGGQKSEILMQRLSQKGIFVSKGSACSSKIKTSRLATALNLSPKYAEGMLRFSLGVFNTKEEIDFLAENLIKIL